ncbi:MAG: hypothetical protein ACRDF5_00620 [bacterium]
MNWRVASVWIAIALTMGLGSPPSRSGRLPGTAALPAGAEWVYRHTSIEGGQTRTGTSTMIYKGLATYRGVSFHLVEYSLTLDPGTLERQFLLWDRGYFRQAAAVVTDGTDTVEIVFDQPIALGGVQESRSGGSAGRSGHLRGRHLVEEGAV